jgi:biopolymer transport protein ExbD
MTSLIDVIFLLLLFFMLSSTFSKFSEVELSAASGGAAIAGDTRPLFLQLHEGRLTLNGQEVALETLEATLLERAEAGDAAPPTPLLISLKGAVTAQRLTDLLVAVRGVHGITPTVLGGA